MRDDDYGVEDFVADLRRLARQSDDEHALLAALRPLAQRLACNTGWRNPRYYASTAEQGFGVHLLHQEPDHSLAVFAASWLPGRGIAPHDHGTWGLVVGVDGAENNAFWERTDDRSRAGRAQLRKIGEKLFGPGDVLAMPSGVIHSVVNQSSQVTLSLHVYGRHVNFTQRSQFDPERGTEAPFIVAVEPVPS
jgi:predicted metal-dependent enzyme (double-stranded beta helix superfamily)